MQGIQRAGRQLLDAAALTGHLMSAGGMIGVLASHRGELFPTRSTRICFVGRGSGLPPIPATQMAAVMTLQVPPPPPSPKPSAPPRNLTCEAGSERRPGLANAAG